MFLAGIIALAVGLSVLGYFGFNKISREIYKKKLLETSIIFEIPSLDIKVPVLEGTDKKTLQYAAGHFENTGELGSGNYCICGHNSTIYACVFNDLDKIETGDEMVLTDNDKNKTTYTYVVTYYDVIDPDSVEVLLDYGDNRITVITCTDDGTERFCVVGKLKE